MAVEMNLYTAPVKSSVEKTTDTEKTAVTSAKKSTANAYETEGSITNAENKHSGETGIYSKESIRKTLEETEAQRLNAMQQMITEMLAKQSDAKGFRQLFDTEQSGLFAEYTRRMELSGEFDATAQDVQDAADSLTGDGYWSAESVSDRILDMAKLLANGDSEQLGTLMDAIRKGFDGAVGLFGKDSLEDMPEITGQTYKMVMDKFDQWEKSFSEDEVAASENATTEAT